MQRSDVHMKMMRAEETVIRLTQKVGELEERIRELGEEVEREDVPATEAAGEPDLDDSHVFENFRRQLRKEIVDNIVNDTYRYSDSLRDFAYIIRSMCPSCYELLRTIIPMPTINNLERHFGDRLATARQGISDVSYLPSLLMDYRATHIPVNYDNGVTRIVDGDGAHLIKDLGGESFIPCVLGVDAMAVEPYSSSNAKDASVQAALRQRSDSEDPKLCYFFVYYLMPLDPLLPNIVVSVVPKINGKADTKTIVHLKSIRSYCRSERFLVVAAAGDGDSGYSPLMDEIYTAVHDDTRGELSYDFLVEHVAPRADLPFITDFLHFAKCLRNKLANHQLSLTGVKSAFSREMITAVLELGKDLDNKSPNSQLKDSIALRVFNLRNLVRLLEKGLLDVALYFMPIVLWRVANQAINITRASRRSLLNAAFDVMRMFERQIQHAGVPPTGLRNATIYLFHAADIKKMLSSLVVLGYILDMPIDRINLARLGTSGLEHLFGTARLGTKGNNGSDRIQGNLVRSQEGSPFGPIIFPQRIFYGGFSKSEKKSGGSQN
jgi:hypothetical protein